MNRYCENCEKLREIRHVNALMSELEHLKCKYAELEVRNSELERKLQMYKKLFKVEIVEGGVK